VSALTVLSELEDQESAIVRVSISDIAEIQIGYQPRGVLETSPDGSHYVIQAKDIRADLGYELAASGLERTTPAREPSSYIVRSGDVLFMARGRRRSATLIEELSGPLPVLALYHFFILRLDQKRVDPGFLVWAINVGPVRDSLARVTVSSTGIPVVSKQDFAHLELDLPQLERQAEISGLYKLSVKEARLARLVEEKRLQFLLATCSYLYEQDGRG
jgi:hypothetical protein